MIKINQINENYNGCDVTQQTYLNIECIESITLEYRKECTLKYEIITKSGNRIYTHDNVIQLINENE